MTPDGTDTPLPGGTPPAAPPPTAPPAAPPAAAPPAAPPPATGTWRDDWRVAMAGEDKKEQEFLGRYADPKAVFDAYKAARTKISSGVVREPFPDKGSPQEQVEWRKANGVPEDATKYDLTLANGVVLGEVDKPIADSFTKFAHGKNWSNDQVKQGLEWYHEFNEAQLLQREEADATYKEDSLAKLGEAWKGEFKRNVREVDDWLKGQPQGVYDLVLDSRGPDGRPLGANPEFIQWLHGVVRFQNPIPTALGGTSETQIKTAKARQAELVKMSGDRKGVYWKGPQSASLQKELLDLNEALAGR